MSEIHLFQIAYNESTRTSVQASGFLLLDNMDNDRPDWYEYWPIRRYLLEQNLIEGDWYAFFSPKFCEKTLLDYASTVAFIRDAESSKTVDVALFSPQPDMGANFLSVFEQAEVFDPGFIQTAKGYLATRGMDVPLDTLVMDSRQIVFSNYFVARPAFWREWFSWTEALFAICEDSTHPLRSALCQQTTYSEGAQRKVFLLERLASLILTLQPKYQVAVCNPYNFGWSASKFREDPQQAFINDALKIAFRDLGFPQYMEAFKALRNQFVGKG